MSKKKFYKRVAKLAGDNVAVTVVDNGGVLTVSLGGGEGGSSAARFDNDDRYAKALGWLKSKTFLVRSSVLRSEVARAEPDLPVDAPFPPKQYSPEPGVQGGVFPSAKRVDAETIRDGILPGFAAGRDRNSAGIALNVAASLLRETGCPAFARAADELEGIVRDKTGEPVGTDPHAEVPA